MAEDDPTYIYKVAIAILIVGLALLSWYLLSVKSKRDELAITAESLRSTNASLAKQIDDLKQTLAGKDVIIAELQENKAKAAGLAASLNQQYAELAKVSELDRAALAASATSLAESKAVIEQNKATIDRINLNIATLQDEIAILRDKNDSLTTQLADATKNAAESGAANATLNNKLVDVMNLYNNASLQLAAQKQSNASLTSQLDAQKQSNASLTSQLDLKNTELAKLNTQITQLNKTIDDMRNIMSKSIVCTGLTGDDLAKCISDNMLDVFFAVLKTSNETLIKAARIYYATNSKPAFKPVAEQYLNMLDKVVVEFTTYYRYDFIPYFTDFIKKYFFNLWNVFPRFYFTSASSLDFYIKMLGKAEVRKQMNQAIASSLAYGLGLTDGFYTGYPNSLRITRIRSTPESLARTPTGIGMLYEQNIYSKETIDLIMAMCDTLAGYITDIILVGGTANLQKNLTAIGVAADTSMNYIKNAFILTSIEVLRETHDTIYIT